MLRFYPSDVENHIIVDYPCTTEDIDVLEKRFFEDTNKIHLEFGLIDIVEKRMIELLYNLLYSKKRLLRITTHSRKLTRYFNKVGIQSKFLGILKNYSLQTSKIDIIVIGGSASSSSKILEIVKNVNLDNLTLVIVQHVEKNKTEIFDKILSQHTKHKVMYAQEAQKIEKGCIYIAPSDRHLKVSDGCFTLTSEAKYNFSRPSISLSYESFSLYYKEKLLVIQECGYLEDGVDKVDLLKQNNSVILVQDPQECEVDSMPMKIIEKGFYNYVMIINDIVQYINFLNKNTIDEVWIEYLLYTIQRRYSYDLRMYHRDTIRRRLDIFMLNHNIKNLKDAIGFILFNHTAFKSFFLEISINITEFFRDPHSFKEYIALIHNAYKNQHHIKVWSAGCSSGEEVYSTAIALEYLAFLDKSIIYATDFNKVILSEAKNGIYSLESLRICKNNLEHIDKNISFDTYIETNDSYFMLNEKIKNKVLFFQHNLAIDASFNEFDIIICKNVIIYFDTILQERVFQLFYDSLKFGGFLILGESENLSKKFLKKFQRHSTTSKIFKKVT